MGVDAKPNKTQDSSSLLKIVNETIPIQESSLTCTCDSQPFVCQACDFTVNDVMNNIGEREAVIRKRFKTDKESFETLRTSGYDELGQGWIERDPETTQTFKRKTQATGLFSLKWSGEDGSGPDIISREEAWKLYIKKLQDESNYLLNSPDNTEICCCEDCIAEYELQCNEVLGWRKRAPTVEGFTKEVNALCDPSTTAVLHTLVQDKYRSLPCSIM